MPTSLSSSSPVFSPTTSRKRPSSSTRRSGWIRKTSSISVFTSPSRTARRKSSAATCCASCSSAPANPSSLRTPAPSCAARASIKLLVPESEAGARNRQASCDSPDWLTSRSSLGGFAHGITDLGTRSGARRITAVPAHRTTAADSRAWRKGRPKRKGGRGLQNNFDAAWRQRALRGDPDAVHSLVAGALAPLYSFCLYRVGRNRHLCEEVVQETLLRAIRDLANYEPDRARHNIFPWLTGLARNEIHRVLGRERSVSLETLWANMDRELLAIFSRLEQEPFADELL